MEGGGGPPGLGVVGCKKSCAGAYLKNMSNSSVLLI